MTWKKICKVNDFLKIKYGMTQNIACYSKKKKANYLLLIIQWFTKMEGKWWNYNTNTADIINKPWH